MDRQTVKEILEDCGIETYAGGRCEAFREAHKLGITVDEMLGKLSDDTVYRAIAHSLRVTGVHAKMMDNNQ